MKIVGPNILLQQPVGTLYCHYATLGNTSELKIKGTTLWHAIEDGQFKGGDTWFINLGEPNPKFELDSDSIIEAYFQMEEGKEKPIDLECLSRYGGGVISIDDQFLIFDDHDVNKLVDTIINRRQICNEDHRDSR
jgi:hypothetical protein